MLRSLAVASDSGPDNIAFRNNEIKVPCVIVRCDASI